MFLSLKTHPLPHPPFFFCDVILRSSTLHPPKRTLRIKKEEDRETRWTQSHGPFRPKYCWVTGAPIKYCWNIFFVCVFLHFFDTHLSHWHRSSELHFFFFFFWLSSRRVFGAEGQREREVFNHRGSTIAGEDDASEYLVGILSYGLRVHHFFFFFWISLTLKALFSLTSPRNKTFEKQKLYPLPRDLPQKILYRKMNTWYVFSGASSCEWALISLITHKADVWAKKKHPIKSRPRHLR